MSLPLFGDASARRKKYKWLNTLGSFFSAGSAVQMLAAAALGVAIGQIILAYTERDFLAGGGLRDWYVEWVSFPGVAFIRLMKCFDLPLIAANIVVGIQGIVKLENAGSTGFRVGILYIFTSIVASIEAVVVFAIFRPIIMPLHKAKTVQPLFTDLRCPNGKYFRDDNITHQLLCDGDIPELFRTRIYGDELKIAAGIPQTTVDVARDIVRVLLWGRGKAGA